MALLRITGAPGEIRTPDLLVRSQALYPTELRARRRGKRSWGLAFAAASPGYPKPFGLRGFSRRRLGGAHPITSPDFLIPGLKAARAMVSAGSLLRIRQAGCGPKAVPPRAAAHA